MSTIPFEHKLENSFPHTLWEKRRVCLAISGGADSVALMRGMVAIAERYDMKERLICLTVDHRLRDAESAEDADFVMSLAASLHVNARLLTANVDEINERAKRLKSLECAARDVRYNLLFSAAKTLGASYLLTAHHQDDQLETMIFRLFRGVGFDGLVGVERYRKIDDSLVLVRPMLGYSKKEILNYLANLKQEYREDSSNKSLVYSRNQVRNELVPVLNSIFPGKWQKALLRLSTLSKEESKYLEKQVDRLEEEISADRLRREKTNRYLLSIHAEDSTTRLIDSIDVATIPAEPLQKADLVILRRFFRRMWENRRWSTVAMGYDEWQRLAVAVKNQTPTQQFPGNISLSFPQPDLVQLERKNERANQ